MKLRPFLLLPLFLALPLFGDDFIPTAQREKATRGDTMLTEYFRNEVALLSQRCLADIKSLDDWKSKREEYRRQLQEMLGLWPMPERTDLKPVVTGRITNDEFTVEKLYFQASPGLYITANLFLPKDLAKPVPAILYECGHWRSITNGISYGNKAVYQMDGAWYARNGYACLVPDTVLAGEIQGIHTGTRDMGLWWWNSRGYTPAGVEAWIGIRALDYLCTRPEVDTNLFGITGHSGGGAYSWTVTALDDRIKAAAPLAGLTDIKHHIVNNLMDSHCDCNFPINIYRWDFPQLAALVAPRPLLIGGTDRDHLFPLEGTENIHSKVHRIYELYDATNKLALAIAPGIHDEVPELRLAVMRWFNLNLKGIRKEDEKPIAVDTKKFFAPEELRVFETLPADNINAKIADTFVPPAKPKKISADKLRAALREKVFAGWPAEKTPLETKRVSSFECEGFDFSTWEFTSQHDVILRLYLMENPKTKRLEGVHLNVLTQTDWTNSFSSMRAVFEEGKTSTNENSVPLISKELKREMLEKRHAIAFFAPRGVGLTSWSGDERRLTRIRRRFMLLGQTLDGMRVWDIRRAVAALHSVRKETLKVSLEAQDKMAANALYAALFEPGVRTLELFNLPKSQSPDDPDYLGLLKVTDLPTVQSAVAAHAELSVGTR